MNVLDERAKHGDRVRREVLGDRYVNGSLASSDNFDGVLQSFLSENCWGLVWTREGLDRPMRSLVTLTALAAGSKWREFESHVRGAIRNGCTEHQLQELFLHLSVYLGVPTAVEAFRIAGPIVASARKDELKEP